MTGAALPGTASARSFVTILALAAALLPDARVCAATPAEEPMSAPARARTAYRPQNELDRLEYLSRGQPDVALPGLLRYADTLQPDDPRLLEALLTAGGRAAGLSMGDEVDRVERRLDALADRAPAARAAAMLLRGEWLEQQGETARAERQLIEASALLPPDPPPYVQLRMLVSLSMIKGRRGNFEDAMKAAHEAIQLADEVGPVWRRIDARSLGVGVLAETGEADKAAELNDEQMRLAAEAGDDLGLSSAWTTRAILLSEGHDDAATLRAWREAIDCAQRAGSKRVVALGLANISDYYLQHGEYPTAYDRAARALPMAREMKNEAAESVALGNMGLALIAMKRKDEGLALVRQSLEIKEVSGFSRSAVAVKELGAFLEKAGYLEDALAAYRQYREMSGDLNRQDRARALVELQEGFANERRQHELDMLAGESRLKDAALLHHELQVKQWTAGGLAGALLLAVVATLSRRLRVRNRQLRASNEQLRVQAEIDPLTGLANRHHLQSVMAASAGRSLAGTLYLIDIDHFKRINDQHGHAGGDAVLVEVAQRLRAILRDDDVVVRWGGEEFIVLVRSAMDAQALAQRLLAVLAQPPVMHEGRPVAVSASIGWGVFPLRREDAPDAGRAEFALDWERAVALVDRAMYVAKAEGRNRACGIRSVRVPDEAALEDIARALDAAWRDGRAELHLQAGPTVQGGLS
jgi:diguanylate cyclase (GGDEF)-like protein